MSDFHAKVSYDRNRRLVCSTWGYVLQNLHKKCRRKSCSDSQQAIAILKRSKLEHGCDSQKGTSTFRCGTRLSPITETAQIVFASTEPYFGQWTCKLASTLERVHIRMIAQKSVSDSDVVWNYQRMVCHAEVVGSKNVWKYVLYSIVNLYIRLQLFSLVKQMISQRNVHAEISFCVYVQPQLNQIHFVYNTCPWLGLCEEKWTPFNASFIDMKLEVRDNNTLHKRTASITYLLYYRHKSLVLVVSLIIVHYIS